MNPILWKILPYIVGASGAIAAVLMFGAQQRAVGEARAHRATAERLQEAYSADSVTRAARDTARAEEIRELNRRLAAAALKQQLAARAADSTTAALRAELQPAQQAQLDAIASNHAKERTYFEIREVQWASKLRLKDAIIADREADIADLRRINTSLQSANRYSPGLVDKAVPFVLGGAAGAAVVVILRAIS